MKAIFLLILLTITFAMFGQRAVADDKRDFILQDLLSALNKSDDCTCTYIVDSKNDSSYTCHCPDGAFYFSGNEIGSIIVIMARKISQLEVGIKKLKKFKKAFQIAFSRYEYSNGMDFYEVLELGKVWTKDTKLHEACGVEKTNEVCKEFKKCLDKGQNLFFYDGLYACIDRD